MHPLALFLALSTALTFTAASPPSILFDTIGIVPTVPETAAITETGNAADETKSEEETVLNEQRIYCIAQSDEEAIRIASSYGLTFIERVGVIAYFINETDTDTNELLRIGIEKGYPPVAIAQPRILLPVNGHDTKQSPNSERKLP